MGKMGYCGIFLLLCGCGVNRASVDPFGFAPDSPCSYWIPDEKAEKLACESLESCPELPHKNHIYSLAEVLDIALVNNPKTEESWATARTQAAEYGQTQSKFFPQIETYFHYTKTRTSFLTSQVEQSQNVAQETLLINDQDLWGPRTKVNWILFDFGQRRYTSEAARYMLYFADYNHNQAIQTLIETVTLDFYNYLYEQKLFEANEADVADAEETLTAAQIGLESGTKNVSDVLQARTQLLLAEITLSEQRSAVKTALATLLDDMGLPSNAEIHLQKLPFIDPSALDLEPLQEYIEIAMQCRPDLLAARAQLASEKNSLQSAKRLWMPVVDYALDIGRTYYSGGFHNDYDMNSVIRVSMPIFTGFHIRNTIRKAEAKTEEATALLKQSELEVIKDVTVAHFNVGVAYNTLRTANELIEAARKQYEVARTQYRAGINTILDVISSQTALFDARAKQAEAIQQWFNSIAILTYSSGIASTGGPLCACE